ncbi:N-acetyltransferase [Ruminococcaceae bacterium OttesenSCG-928-O06]|nr:N-acetyltransferase [Ruminococcaceae bacterium OttesenSCG-928-O06]
MKITHNEEKTRFDLYDDAGTHVGEIEYMRGGNNELYATHTEVFPGSEGKGYAGHLLQALVDYAAGQDAKIVPICGYVKAKFTNEPEKYAAVIK